MHVFIYVYKHVWLSLYVCMYDNADNIPIGSASTQRHLVLLTETASRGHSIHSKPIMITNFALKFKITCVLWFQRTYILQLN